MDTVHLLIYETCILYNYMTAFISNSCYKYKRATESAERAQPRCFVYRPPVRPIVPICPSIYHTGGSTKNGW